MTRFLAALIVPSAPASAAFAETQDCKTIADPALRLDGSGYVDPQSGEDAQLREQMRNICRGC